MIRVFSILLVIILLAGCAAPEPPAAASATETVTSEPETTEPITEAATEPETEPEAEPVAASSIELKNPDELTIYEAPVSSTMIFSGVYQEHPVPFAVENPTLLDVVAAIEEYHGITFPVLSITQRKGFVTVDFAESIIEDNGKAQAYWMLTTLGATLRENLTTFERVQYRMEGEVGVFGDEWEIPPLKLVEGNPEEFTAIRAGIPYVSEESVYGDTFSENYQAIVGTDETSWKLASYLSKLHLAGRTLQSLAGLPNEHIIETAVYATLPCYSDVSNENEINYYPELKPFEVPAGELTGLGFPETMFWLKEHVEETIRILYGDVDYEHQSFMGDKFQYLELLGVYTPTHMGGGSTSIPVILSYEETEDEIVAEVAYLSSGMSGYAYASHNPDGGWVEFSESELEDFARDKAARHTVTVSKEPDGRFLLKSQTLSRGENLS
jgi:hypothetical protein